MTKPDPNGARKRTHLYLALYERSGTGRAHVIEDVHQDGLAWPQGWRDKLRGHAPPFKDPMRWVSTSECGYGDDKCRQYENATEPVPTVAL